MIVLKHIKMELSEDRYIPAVDAMQNDACSRALVFRLLNNGKNWPVPQDARCAVSYRKPDGMVGIYDTLPDGSPAVTVDENNVSVILAPQALTTTGKAELSVIMQSSTGNRLATFGIALVVHPDPSAGKVESDNYFNVVSFLPQPENAAKPGQYFEISAVDDLGRVTGLKAVPAPSGSGISGEEAEQIKKNTEDIEKLNTGKLDADKLPKAVNNALAQAKASGEFDGAPGQPGDKGDPGRTPVKGVDYFTEADKQEIAGRAAGMVEVPAANWNARPGAPGHILNRTHWVEVTKGEEIPVDGFWNNDNGTEDQFVFISPINLENGKSYVVEWNGVEYQCTAIEVEYQGVGAVGIGNTVLIGGEDTGEPFGIMELIADGELRCFAFAVTPGAVPFSIYHGTEVVHKLPEKYLDLPAKLPNPQSLSFTGAVSATYDGSEAVSIEIPSGGGGSGSGSGGGSGNSGYDILIDITTTEAVTEIQSDIISVEAAEKFKMAHEVFLWVYVPFDTSDTTSTDVGTVTVSVRASSWTWAWLSAIPIIPNPTQTYTKGGYIFAKASIPPYNYTSFPTCKSYAEYIYGIWGLANSDKYVAKANDPSGDFVNMVGGKSAMFKLVGSRSMPAGTRLVAGVIA